MNLHERLVYAVADARREIERSREISPIEVRRALLTTLGIPALVGHKGHGAGTGMTGVLERHRPRTAGDCAICCDPWPCDDVKNVQRVLSQLGYPVHS